MSPLASCCRCAATLAETSGVTRPCACTRSSALSPNGIGLSNGAMLNMALCDEIISVDAEKMQVTVQAGARVNQVGHQLSRC